MTIVTPLTISPRDDLNQDWIVRHDPPSADPAGKIRLIMYYPMNIGRSMDEIKRVLSAMQTSDANECAMPLNWKKGGTVIVPPPITVAAMTEREASKYEMTDFYLARREL